MSAVRTLIAIFMIGCATSTTPGTPDMQSKKDICPDNPGLCPGMCCGDVCVDTTVDVRNCGACGKQCASGTVCEASACGCLPTGAACGTGQSCCGNNGCKSLMSDINNCGTCGKACGIGSVCTNGACVCGTMTCTGTQTCCNGTCATTCATAPPDMAMGTCVCASGCPLSGICVGPNCCFEDYIIGGTCKPSITCLQSGP